MNKGANAAENLVAVAVCIVSFRNPDDIVRCLAALGHMSHAAFEVVICENGGPEAAEQLRMATPAILPGGQPVRIIEAPGNLGYAGGVNVCMRAASTARAWWILNPDTQPEPDALSAMVARLALGDVDAVGCAVCTATGVVESCGGHWRPWLARAVSLGQGRRAQGLDAAALEPRLSYLSGASMLVGRGLRDRVGLMREDYFLYGEEVEWCLRATAAGLRLGVATDAVVLHHQGTTTGSVADVRQRSRISVFLDERNKLLVTRDRFARRLPLVMFATLALLTMRFARRGAWRQVRYALGGWWAGVMGRRGPPAWL
jgi:N-acetylglucosaminyl-diphospho-decaprenol L-rhamnosyltransferase